MSAQANRPAGAPQGLIRAHMATFPEREGVFRTAVEAILPQVDRMVILFNGYTDVPPDIAANPRIESITTDVDTRDLGRFFQPPGADDIVFLLDDDIGYPSDYVARSIEQASLIGWDGAVFGYQGFVYRDGSDGRPRGWRQWRSFDRLPKARGARMLGCGTVVARGDKIPSISWMAPYIGHSDAGFALHALNHGWKAWALPRPEGWLAEDMTLPEGPRPTPPLPVVAALRKIIDADLDHVDVAHSKYAKAGGGARSAAKATGA